jgi:hypothetical protein
MHVLRVCHIFHTSWDLAYNVLRTRVLEYTATSTQGHSTIELLEVRKLPSSTYSYKTGRAVDPTQTIPGILYPLFFSASTVLDYSTYKRRRKVYTLIDLAKTINVLYIHVVNLYSLHGVNIHEYHIFFINCKVWLSILPSALKQQNATMLVKERPGMLGYVRLVQVHCTSTLNGLPA